LIASSRESAGTLEKRLLVVAYHRWIQCSKFHWRKRRNPAATLSDAALAAARRTYRDERDPTALVRSGGGGGGGVVLAGCASPSLASRAMAGMTGLQPKVAIAGWRSTKKQQSGQLMGAHRGTCHGAPHRHHRAQHGAGKSWP
jgi:hypothetical protein